MTYPVIPSWKLQNKKIWAISMISKHDDDIKFKKKEVFTWKCHHHEIFNMLGVFIYHSSLYINLYVVYGDGNINMELITYLLSKQKIHEKQTCKNNLAA